MTVGSFYPVLPMSLATSSSITRAVLPSSLSQPSLPRCSPNPAVQETIEKLLKLGCPPIPIAPRQDPYLDGYHRIATGRVTQEGSDLLDGLPGSRCPLDANLAPLPLFSGKNPSHIGPDGKVYLTPHGDFQQELPTFEQLRVFFHHPAVGVATLGGHQGIVWLDFDAKCYPEQQACDFDVEQVVEQILCYTGCEPEDLWLEQTGSGGYRIPLQPRFQPEFTQFATLPDGFHTGEVLGLGKCAILAPTIHPNGRPYRRLLDGEPMLVDRLEAVGIYPFKAVKQPRYQASGWQSQPAQRSSGYRSGFGRLPDMRELAPYLEGYHERREWAYAQCPGTAAHPQPESLTSLSINLSTGAFHLFCGCDAKVVYHAAFTLAKQRGYQS